MNNYNISLNSEQKKAVEILTGPVLVIAGAGSGKTRVLTAHICNLINNGVSPQNILAITFTNKAAKEMKERIDSFVGSSSVWASTFHSLCARILRSEISILDGYNSDFTIYSEEESARVVKDIIKSTDEYNFQNKDFYVHEISYAKSHSLSPSEFYDYMKGDRSYFSEKESINFVYNKYEKSLRLSNALDFDDLLVKTVEIFEKFPHILEKYQDKFKYINVDEYQDTNSLQNKLVNLLSKKYNNIFVVGDEDQSIYSWRGAIIDNILDFPKCHPGCVVIKLEQNYRSTSSILESANKLIAVNQNRNIKNLWSEDKESNSVEYYSCYNDRDEADKILAFINYNHKLGIPYSEMAVLVRMTSITRLLEEKLNLYQIPYKVFGGFKFFERTEIKNVFAYLRLAINPSDNDAISRIINIPPRGIGEKTQQDLKDLADLNNYNLFTTLLNLETLSSKLFLKYKDFIDLILDLIDKYKRLTADSFVKYVIDKSHIKDCYPIEKDTDNQAKLQNIDELYSDIVSFMIENKDKTLTDYLESVALISDSDDAVDGEYVSISTVHAAKGLEYAHVYLMGMEQGIFPSSLAIDSGDIEEERRLMYVAITRAKKKLYVLDSQRRFRFGQVKDESPSQFIKEMRVPIQIKKYNIEQSNTVFNKIYKEEKSTSINTFKQYKLNSVVRHTKYGDGVIVDIEDTLDDRKVTIEFRYLGKKTFSLSIAHKFLEIVGSIDETEGC